MIDELIKSTVRDIYDFPKEGIVFKDITPILKDHELCKGIVDAFVQRVEGQHIDAVAGIESRGFLFGMMIAQHLQIPFIPIRKKGKLPAETISESYQLEYGSAILEMHSDAVAKDAQILIHDDLLATGGTAEATARLIIRAGATVAAYSFIVGLGFLNGQDKIKPFSDKIITLANY